MNPFVPIHYRNFSKDFHQDEEIGSKKGKERVRRDGESDETQLEMPLREGRVLTEKKTGRSDH